MPEKNKGEVLVRVKRLFAIAFMLCLAVILIYFVALLATGQINNSPRVENNSVDLGLNQNQIPPNILSGEIRKVEGNNIDFFDVQKNQLLNLTVSEYVVIDTYNPSKNTNEELILEKIQPVALANLVLDDQGQILHITVLPAISISGQVENNQAGVISLKYNNLDYVVRVNANTIVNKQKADNTIENDLTVSDIRVGDVISVVSDNETKVGTKSFVAGLISILSQS